jgi:hypothetical protein
MWTDLDVGNHQVCFGEVPGFLTPACQQVSLTAGATQIVTGTFTVAIGVAAGSISGTITGPHGAPISGIWVYTGSGPSFASTTTSDDGTYSLVGLSPGAYQLLVTDYSNWAGTYAGTWYPNNVTPLTLQVSDGQALNGIDANVAIGGSVSGKVTDKAGNPIAGISVNVSATFTRYATTAVDGTYTVRGVDAGQATVVFFDPTNTYPLQYYNGVPLFELATKVTVGPGLTVSNINATM